MPAIDPARPPRGFTLVEALVASVVLAILVLGVCQTLALSYRQRISTRSNATAVALARQLADEITAKPLADPVTGSVALGPNGLTSRASFTCVVNYSGYTDTSAALPMLAGGMLSTSATNDGIYTRNVSVQLGAAITGDARSPTTDFAVVTVKVTAPSGETANISKLVPKYQIQR